MALTTCPDCGHKVSSLAPTCPSCGRPLAPHAIPLQPVAGGARACPYCRANTVGRVRGVHGWEGLAMIGMIAGGVLGGVAAVIAGAAMGAAGFTSGAAAAALFGICLFFGGPIGGIVYYALCESRPFCSGCGRRVTL